MRRVVVMLVLLAIGVWGGVAQHQYAFYYDLSGGRDLEITVINPMFDQAVFVISAHDAYGTKLWSDTGTLESAASGFILLSEVVPASDVSWGLVTVSSTERLLFGLEYSVDGTLISVDSIAAEIVPFAVDKPHWLGAYYSQAGGSRTVVIVMNPWPESTWCRFQAYNSQGAGLYTRELVLAPYEAEFIDLTSVLGAGALIWGLADITMLDRPVILALEYAGRGCEGLIIENVTVPYN